MKHRVFQRDEFLSSSSISTSELEEWEKLGLISRPGKIDSQIPYYSETNLTQAQRIKQLLEVGFNLEDIQKIVRKVGLPDTSTSDSIKGQLEELLTVGELSSRTGLNSRTLKYWEERGIIQPDGRSPGGFRLYAQCYIELCKLIRDLQNFGYSLKEIKLASDLFRDFIALKNDASDIPVADIRKHLETMRTKIAELDERMKMLKQGVRRWDDMLRKKRREISQLVTRYSNNTKPTGDKRTKNKSTKKKKSAR